MKEEIQKKPFQLFWKLKVAREKSQTSDVLATSLRGGSGSQGELTPIRSVVRTRPLLRPWGRRGRKKTCSRVQPGVRENAPGAINVKPAGPHSHLGLAATCSGRVRQEASCFPSCCGLGLKCPSMSHVSEVWPHKPNFQRWGNWLPRTVLPVD